MRLKVLLPMRIFLDQEVTKVIAEAANGSFCLLPKHIDFVAVLVPGIISFESERGVEYIAADEGVLVKRAHEVRVSTRRAVRSRDLGELKSIVEREFRTLDEKEKKTRSILAKLEADFAKSFFGKI
ncbi:MAG: F0F1 ATP synthase subunit epsilon [Methanosaeta sp. PtaU1.Bin112]|nr:MAG: F0F1 ATP synthase subunit epsilon [Methanosaeta sp. PtaU1.Bin112]